MRHLRIRCRPRNHKRFPRLKFLPERLHSYRVRRPRGAGAGARHRLRGLIDSELVMDGDGADRFGAFVNALAEVVGHAGRARALGASCMGLLPPAERKSVEPLAAVTAPSRVSAQHQSLLHFVAQSAWSGARVTAKVSGLAPPPPP